MWNKSRQEETTKCGVAPMSEDTLAPLATRPLENGKDPTLMSNILAAEAKPDSLLGGATIGKTVKVVGQIYSKEDLFVDGNLEGTVEAIAQKLTIGPNGSVHASVKAHNVLVLGMMEGNVEAADQIEIGRDAKVVGDIRTARIQIEDGAYFKGSIDIVKLEPLKTADSSQAVASTTAPNPAALPHKFMGQGRPATH